MLLLNNVIILRTYKNNAKFHLFHSDLGSRGNYDVSRSMSGDLDDSGMLLKNTKDNEYVIVLSSQGLGMLHPSSFV